MKHFFLTLLCCSIYFFSLAQEDTLLNPDDTLVIYDPLHKPAIPPKGEGAKWVVTPSVFWVNSSSFKSYYFDGMPFRIKFPTTYKEGIKTGKKYPMVVFIHGVMEAGDIYDNEKQMKWGALYLKELVDTKQYDGFLLFPQNKDTGWNRSSIITLFKVMSYMNSYANLDMNRIVVMGVSLGANVAWRMAAFNPPFFAGIVALSGFKMEDIEIMPRILAIPSIFSMGEKDEFFSIADARKYADTLQHMGGHVRTMFYGGFMHESWDNVFRDHALLDLLLTANKTNPLLIKGKSNFKKDEKVAATLSVSPGFDGYKWRKNGVVVSNGGFNELNVKEPGTYDVQLFRKGEGWSHWSAQPAVITQE